MERRHSLIWDAPRTLDLDWSVAGYGGLERLPEYQNVAAPYRNFATGRMTLTYSFVDRSLGAVDDEKGVRWQLGMRHNYVNGTLLPRVYGTWDYGFLLPLKNSPVWLRTAVGHGFGEHNQPFANFYFGGFGNNWVDRLSTSRYREYYTFPGLELNQVGAKSFGRVLGEWNLPPLRFRKLGTSFLYCNWARLSLFGAGLATGGGNRYVDSGAQLDFRIVAVFVSEVHLLRGLRGGPRPEPALVRRVHGLPETAMSGVLIARVLSGALPVLAFLLALMWLDSYKLLAPRRILWLLGQGALVAVVCAVVNSLLFARIPH